VLPHCPRLDLELLRLKRNFSQNNKYTTHHNMALTMTKLDIYKKHLKPKCDSSSKYETLKFLRCKCEDP
jgi:hypothetical protein